MRGKEYLTAVRADEDVLALDTLFFADEVRDPHQLDALPGRKKANGRQLDTAVSLIDAMSGEWQPEEYHDTYTAKVHRLIEDKRNGKEIVTEDQATEATGIVDLMDALRRSVEGVRSSRGRRGRSEIDEASKSELDELGRELKIKGRSKMNRAELLRSVKRQQRKAS
jgi:DNA end-binding protein Ku